MKTFTILALAAAAIANTLCGYEDLGTVFASAASVAFFLWPRK
jgi:hypothetical protein